MKVSKKHIWIETNGDIARIGLTDYAQSQLKAIMFANLADEGDQVEIGETFGDVESIKDVTDLISPVSGEVIAVNEDVCDEPSLINEEPYESWLIEVRYTAMDDDVIEFDEYDGGNI